MYELLSSWPMTPLIIGLPYDHQYPTGIQQFAYKNLWPNGLWPCGFIVNYASNVSLFEVPWTVTLACMPPGLLLTLYQF